MRERSFELEQRRGVIVEQMRAIHDAAEAANRAPTADEETRFAALTAENEALEKRIKNAKLIERAERAEAGEPITGNRNGAMDLRGYSLARAIRSMDGGRLDGIEAEAHQELSRGRDTRGIMVPVSILFAERRAQSVSPDTAGGFLVQTNVAPVDDYYRATLMVQSRGATVLSGLVGDLDLPKLSASGSTHWVGEGQNTTASSATFEKYSMSPKTVSAEYEFTRRMRLQANESIEGILRRDMGQLLASAVDAAAIRSSGAPTEPTGILNTSGVQQVNTETLLSDTVNNLIAELETNNVPGAPSILTNSVVMKTARGLRDGEDRLIPITQTFHGFTPAVSNQVPSNLGVGNNKSAIIAGKFSELYLGYWSGADLLLNPYADSVASKGSAKLHGFLDMDCVVRHPEAFAYALV